MKNRISCSWRWGGSCIMDHAQRGEVDASVDDRDLPNSFLLLPQFSCRARNLTSVVRNATYHHQRKHISVFITRLFSYRRAILLLCCLLRFLIKNLALIFWLAISMHRTSNIFSSQKLFTLTWNLQKSFNFSSFYFILLNVLHKLHLINLLYTPGNLDMQKSWRSCTPCQLKVKTKTTFNLNWKCH